MISARGIQSVADSYSSAATPTARRAAVTRWRRGGTPTASTARSVSRQGRQYTGPAVRLQDPSTGRVRYLVSPSAISARESLLRRERTRRERMFEEATTPAEYASIEARETVDYEQDITDFVFEWEDELDDLRQRSASGEEYYEGSSLFEDWAQWRSSYNSM
jgi:hypothetical protein